MSNPLVSIIIPTYNRAHLIGETLDSVLAQTYTNWECIIVDDGSTDNTDEVVSQYLEKDNRFQYHHRPAARLAGGNAARNYGFEVSKGEYINWFDSDDIMVETKIEKQVLRLSNNGLNLSVCQSLVFEKNRLNVLGIRHNKISSDNSFQDYLVGNIVWLTQAPLWEKDFLNHMEYLFDETLQASQEWEFFCRILYTFNLDYDVLEEPLVYIRKHEDSISYAVNIELRTKKYIEARKKLYLYLKRNDLPNETISYFGNYFISKYKKYLKSKNYIDAYKILINPLLVFKKFTPVFKMKMIMVLVTFIFFNKGEFLFKGVRYNLK